VSELSYFLSFDFLLMFYIYIHIYVYVYMHVYIYVCVLYARKCIAPCIVVFLISNSTSSFLDLHF
jgi:hypothetical protein